MLFTVAGLFSMGVVLSCQAAAADAEFVPAFAADQPRITTFAINYENDEFQALKDAEHARAQSTASQINAKTSEKALERAKSLIKIHQISDIALSSAQLQFLTDKKEELQHSADADEAMARAAVARVMILEQGQPNKNFLRDLTMARIEGETAKLRGCEAALEIAVEKQRLLTLEWENGGSLKGVLSDAEIEDRQAKKDVMSAAVQELKNQIEFTKKHLEALQKALSRSDLNS